MLLKLHVRNEKKRCQEDVRAYGLNLHIREERYLLISGKVEGEVAIGIKILP